MGSFPEDEMNDLSKPHPNEIRLTGSAGSVVVFTGHTWHGGVKNKTKKSRGSITAYFCQRDQPQQLNQREALQSDTSKRLSDGTLFLLDA